jgi:YHS domain-containing protein/ATP-dependent Lon protease
MATVDTLLHRIDAEFSTLDAKIKQAQAEKLQEHKARQERLAAFAQQLESLRAIWKPRLDTLVQRFGDKVKATPKLSASSRDVSLEFQSNLAKIRLRFSASIDRDVRKLLLDYNLEIIPVLMQFDSHQQAEWPIEAIDQDAMAAWIDDRIVDFVKTYLSLHENEYYLKEHMVEDPVAGVRFPRFAAAATVEANGKTYYFISEETRREFEARQGAAAKG